MADYRLTATRFDHITERHPTGQPKKVVKYRAGDRVTGLSEKEVGRLLAAGAIRPWVDEPEPADGPAPEAVVEPDQGDGDEPEPADGPARPRITATKKVWVEYATTRGWSREDAEKLDKSDLIDRLS